MENICETQPTTDLTRGDVQQKHHKGVGRLGFWGGMLGLSVLQRVCDAAEKGESGVAFVGLIVILVLAFALVVIRLRNIGMNGWWSLLTLVPIAGFYVLIRCLVCPEGYEDSKKLDTTGRAIAGVCITLILLVVVALGLPVGKAVRSPSPCEASGSTPTFAPVLPGTVKLPESTPSSRLVGRWRNVDNSGEVIYSAVDQLGTGTYRLHNGSSGITGPAFRFKVVSEDESGTALVLRDFNPIPGELAMRSGWHWSQSDIVCRISKDGCQMTQEHTIAIDGDSSRIFTVYQRSD